MLPWFLLEEKKENKMTIQTEEIEFCKVKVHYVAETDKVISKRKDALNAFKNVQIPGFRKGKAPPYILELRLKERIDNWVKQELLTDAFTDIIFETKIKPMGYPQPQSVNLHGSDFWCEVLMFKKPDFELKQYKDFEIPAPAMPITAADMAQKILQELRKTNGDFAPYEENDFVEMGDKVTMDVNCFKSEEKIDDMCQEGILYTIGQNMYPGFDDNLLGMAAGEERTFTMKLDGSSDDTMLKVKIHMGLKSTPAPLDDSLAQKVGLKDFTSLMKEIENISGQRTENTKNQMISQQVIKRLLAENPFEVPEWAYKLEAQQISGKHTEAEFQTLPVEQREMCLNQAKDNVRLSFILDTLAEVEPETCYNDMEVVNIIKSKVQQAGQNPDQFVAEASKNGKLNGMAARVRSEAALQWVISKCKIVD